MPAPDRTHALRLPLLLAALLVAGPVLAAPEKKPPPGQQLKAVEKEIGQSREKQAQLSKEAEALADELAELRDESVRAARQIQDREGALSETEKDLADLGVEEEARAAKLNEREARRDELLMALTRLARNPPEGLALAPGEPADALRSAKLLGVAIPEIQAEARAIQQDIQAIATLRKEIAGKRDALVAQRNALSTDQRKLALLATRKAALREQAEKGAEASGKRVQQLTAQATSLHELIEKLEAERKQREAEERKRREELQKAEERRLAEQATREQLEREARPSPSGKQQIVMAPPPVPSGKGTTKPRNFAQSRGGMVYPASGNLASRYGETDRNGIVAKGMTIETRPGATVVSPFDGKVLFAGPFRGYGQILIIAHGDGYHSLLAGLDRIDGTVGQVLVAGEPVGVMGNAASDGKPDLYLELRHNGQPINPMPWLASHEEKVSG